MNASGFVGGGAASPGLIPLALKQRRATAALFRDASRRSGGRYGSGSGQVSRAAIPTSGSPRPTSAGAMRSRLRINERQG